MTLQQLRDFLCVAGVGSFRAAARHLGVSQAGLTNSIKALETSLETRLFLRTGHGVQLTPAGERLSLRAQLIDAESQRITAELKPFNQDDAGEVRVGLSQTAACLLLTPVVPDFRARHPSAQLRLYEGLYERLMPSLLRGQLDFAILSVFGSEISKELTVRRLLQTSMVIVARRGHPKSQARRLAELEDQAWVFSGPVGAPGATVMRLFGNAGLTPPKAAITCETLTQVSALLLSTDYLALLPRLVLENGLLPKDLVEIRFSDALLHYDLCLVHRSTVPLTPLSATLASMLTSSVTSLRSKTGRGVERASA